MLAGIQCCVLIERRELRLHTPRGTVRTHNRYTACTQQHTPTPTHRNNAQRTTTTHTHTHTHTTHTQTRTRPSLHDKLCHKRTTARAESASGAPAGMRRAAACLTAQQPHKVIVSMTKRANRSMKISIRKHRTVPQNTRASLLNRY
jgi:hypothetical protein